MLKKVLSLFIIVMILLTMGSCAEILRPKPTTEPDNVVDNRKNYLVVCWPILEAQWLLTDAWEDFCKLREDGEKLELIILPAEALRDSLYEEDPEKINETADVFLINNFEHMMKYNDFKGFFQNFEEFDLTKINSELADNAKAFGCFDNGTYGIPFVTSTNMWGMNKSFMETNQLELPRTHDEVRQITRDTKNYEIIDLSYESFFSLIWRLGGEFFNEDGSKAAFNTPDTGIRAVEMIDESSEKGVGINGIFAMGDRGPKLDPNDVNGMMPQLKEGIPGYSVKSASNFCIRQTSVNKQLAFDFIEYFTTSENPETGKTYQEELCQKVFVEDAIIPTLKVAQERIANDETNKKKVVLEQINISKQIPYSPVLSEVIDILVLEMFSVTRGEKTPEVAMRYAEQEINMAIGRYLRENKK